MHGTSSLRGRSTLRARGAGPRRRRLCGAVCCKAVHDHAAAFNESLYQPRTDKQHSPYLGPIRLAAIPGELRYLSPKRCALPATNGMANLPRLLLPGAGLGWEAQQPLQAGQLLLVDNALAILHGQQVSSRSPRVWHHAALAQPTIMLAGMAGP